MRIYSLDIASFRHTVDDMLETIKCFRESISGAVGAPASSLLIFNYNVTIIDVTHNPDYLNIITLTGLEQGKTLDNYFFADFQEQVLLAAENTGYFIVTPYHVTVLQKSRLRRLE